MGVQDKDGASKGHLGHNIGLVEDRDSRCVGPGTAQIRHRSEELVRRRGAIEYTMVCGP